MTHENISDELRMMHATLHRFVIDFAENHRHPDPVIDLQYRNESLELVEAVNKLVTSEPQPHHNNAISEELQLIKTGKAIIVPNSVDHAKAMILVAGHYLKHNS